jgi:predicted acetyltransferase
MKSHSGPVSGTGQDERLEERASEGSKSGEKLSGIQDAGVAADARVQSRAAWRVVRASAGDHHGIQHFLMSVHQGPSAAEFQAQLEEPSYETADRLLIRDRGRLVAHLRLLNRELRFGKVVLPAGIVADVAVLPEYQGRGCRAALLEEARKQLLRQGAVLGLLQTDQPHGYTPLGWTVAGRHSYSFSGPREILSHLQSCEEERASLAKSSFARHHRRHIYNIRMGRHVEQPALMRLYAQATRNAYGPLERNAAYWRWLISRGGQEHFYVAIDGPDKLDLDESVSRIVGYAAAKEGRILELVAAPDHPDASIQLLARACGDAIEHDFHHVRLDAPPDDPLHQLLQQSGGKRYHHESDHGVVFMTAIFKTRRLLKALARPLNDRVKQAGFNRPCQLGLRIDGEKYSLSVSRRSVRLIAGKLGRSYLNCTRHDLHQLLLGHVDVRRAVASGRLFASTRVALDISSAMFPCLPVWRPPWDDVPT